MTIYIPGPLVRCARGVAIMAHTDCNQRYGDLPYVAHLADVASNAIGFCDLLHPEARDIAIAAAWLHDVLEDTHTSYNDLLRAFAGFHHNDVAKPLVEIVFALTNNKGRTRNERADDAYYYGIRRISLATYVKLCDRLANVQNAGRMIQRYKAEHADFRKRIDFVGYYDYEPIWAELDRLLGTGAP